MDSCFLEYLGTALDMIVEVGFIFLIQVVFLVRPKVKKEKW